MARKTVLISDMSGQEIAEGKGATIRITFHDARKGVRELDVTDARGGQARRPPGRAPRATPEERRLERPQDRGPAVPLGAAGPNSYNQGGGALPRGRSGERRQGGAAARPLPRGHRPRSDPRRPNRAEAERIERELLDRTPAPLRRLDRNVRRPLRPHRLRRRRPAGGQLRAAAAPDPAGRRLGLAERALRVGALPRLRGRARQGDRRTPPRACSTPPISTGRSPGLYARYLEELDRLGRWDRQQRRRYAAGRIGERARGVGRPAGLPLRVRGLHRRRVDARRGARRARRRHRVAPVRARAARVRLARAHGDRPDAARGGPDRRAAARPVGPGARARPPGAHALRRGHARRGRAAARRGGALPRGVRVAGRHRAGRGGDPRPPARRASPRTRSPSSGRAWSAFRAPLETVFGVLGIPYSIEGSVPLDRTPFGRALLGAAALRLAGRNAAPALRLPPLALLGAAAASAPISWRAGCADAP